MVQPGNPYQSPEPEGQPTWGQQPPASDPWGPSACPQGWQDQGQTSWPPQPPQGYDPTPQTPSYGAPTPPYGSPAATDYGPPVVPQPGYGPLQPGYPAAPDPWAAAPVSAAPTSGWPGPAGPPPPPPRSNTGMIVGLVGGGIVVLLLVVVGLVLLLRQEDRKPPVANPNPTTGTSASPTERPSPTPNEKDPDTLDSAESDTATVTADALFGDASFTGDNDETYTLVGKSDTSACTGLGAGAVKDLMKKYDCGDMVVGVYLNDDEDLFSAVLVVPLDSDDDAEAAHGDIGADKQKYIDVLIYYCPSDGKPGADLCERKSDNLPTWYASFTTFHRYLLVAISLYTDGHRTSDLDEIDEMTTETIGHLTEVLLRAG